MIAFINDCLNPLLPVSIVDSPPQKTAQSEVADHLPPLTWSD